MVNEHPLRIEDTDRYLDVLDGLELLEDTNGFWNSTNDIDPQYLYLQYKYPNLLQHLRHSAPEAAHTGTQQNKKSLYSMSGSLGSGI